MALTTMHTDAWHDPERNVVMKKRRDERVRMWQMWQLRRLFRKRCWRFDDTSDAGADVDVNQHVEDEEEKEDNLSDPGRSK